MENIIDIIIKLVAALLVAGAGWLVRYLIAWAKTKLNKEQSEKLDLFITEMVAAAEQMYKDVDTTGEIRLNYVEKMLMEAGYEITEAVRAMIEAKVFAINIVSKAGESQ